MHINCLWIRVLLIFLCTFSVTISILGQMDTVVIGAGVIQGVSVTTSDGVSSQEGENTINQSGYLPNKNAASRLLSQSAMGYRSADIDNVTTMGIEDWIEGQLSMPIAYTLESKVREYHDFVRNATNDTLANSRGRFWEYAWWQYHMTSQDILRQRVAYSLSQLLVISRNSNFGNNPYALGSYYDILLQQSFGNYRVLLEKVTYHAAMGRYLTYLNNPKTDTTSNRFPDENYARELMQLFTIGTTVLNMDGTEVVDSNNAPIPTYDNDDITEFSKVFTGLSWEDRDNFYRGPRRDTSYALPMKMFEQFHEPGIKILLNNDTIPDRNPVDGKADISDALDNLFNHSNTPPFVAKFLIQRLVTANPIPAYVQRVAQVFVDNGAGVRGDMKAVIRAILLDPAANSCATCDDPHFGYLKEPFVRYMHLNKGLEVTTASGNYRNAMGSIYYYTGQSPLYSPSVFNFFQQDYQPIGDIQQAGLVAPVFQITNSQTITGYFNALDRFVNSENIADEYDLYSGEPDSTYINERSIVDIANDTLYMDDDQLHILIDKYNLLFAQGNISTKTSNRIRETVRAMPKNNTNDKKRRVRTVLYMVLGYPESLINK